MSAFRRTRIYLAITNRCWRCLVDPFHGALVRGTDPEIRRAFVEQDLGPLPDRTWHEMVTRELKRLDRESA